MKLAWHIFRKDVRYLRLEIGLLIALAALFAMGSSSGLAGVAETLLIVGIIHLTSRAIHAEPVPGTGQFWVTRPYPWRSLLIAKLLFIAVCIDVPIGVARFAALAVQGYPLGASLPALLWSQLLLFGAGLPIAALAAVTSGIMEFSVGMLGLAVAYLVIFFVSPSVVFRIRLLIWPVSVEWLHESMAFVLFTAIAAAVLLWQYRDRRTAFSRGFAMGAVAVSAAFYIAIPAAAGLTVETWLSRGKGPSLRLAVGAVGKVAPPGRSLDDVSRGLRRVPVGIIVQGLPTGMEIAADGLNVSLDWPDGGRWHGSALVTGADTGAGGASISGAIAIPIAIFSRISMPARMRGSLYLTLFGDPESRTIPFTSHPVNAQDDLQCYSEFNSRVRSDNFSTYSCRAFFGWPSRLVYAKTSDLESEFTRLVSYSLFPSGLDPGSSESRYTSLVMADRSGMGNPIHDVTIVTKKPLVHLRRGFDFSGVRKSDFIVGEMATGR